MPNPAIAACAHNATGAMRLLHEGQDCKSSETLISWNRQGEPGPRGPQGEAGPAGPEGPAGPIGQAPPLLLLATRGNGAGFLTLGDAAANAWTPDALPTSAAIHVLHGSGPENVWAGGSLGTLLRWNGAEWQQMESPVTSPIQFLFVLSETRVYMGAGGAMFGSDGLFWFMLPRCNATSTGIALWASSHTEVWLSTGGATVCKWNGSTLSAPMTAPVTGTITAIQGLSATNLLVATNQGSIAHYNGATWTAHTTGTTQPIHALWYASANQAWAVGAQGTALRYDGTTWSRVPTPTTHTLTTIRGTSPTDIHAGGPNVGLHHDGIAWTVFPSPIQSLYVTPGFGKAASQAKILSYDPTHILDACTDVCLLPQTPGTSLTVKATPDSQSRFVRWTGACTHAEPTCLVTLDTTRFATATFHPK